MSPRARRADQRPGLDGRGRTALVTGASGQVGRELVPLLRSAGWTVVACDRQRLDITDRQAVLATVGDVKPHAVVNLAAFTAVDAAELEPEPAWAANAMAVRHLTQACTRVGARLCHLSTDYVFDGTSDSPYDEWATPDPVSVYGRSKRAGELELSTDALLVRTSWVCGAHGANAVRTLLAMAGDPERRFAYVDDQRGCPTMAADLAGMVARLVGEGHTGTFHVTNGGAVSWYEFAREVLEVAGHDPDRVHPVSTADLQPPRPAPRPRNSVLDGLALRLCGLPPLRDHVAALRDLVGQIQGVGTAP